MKKFFFVFCMFGTLLFAKDSVTVSILPQAYFVKQIAGDTLDINVMVGKGDDPHTYEPKPQQMVNLEKSKIYFTNGLEYENVWLPKFEKSYPNIIVVNTSDGIKLIPMAHHHHHHAEHANVKEEHEDHDHHKHEDEDHDHEEHEHHHHHGLDPHVWLDPILVKTQAQNIANALIKVYPNNKALYEKNLANFDKKLDELNKYISNKLKNVKNKSFIVYHPSWGYYAKRYNLVQIPIEIEGKDPKPADIEHLIDEAKEHHIKVIFVMPQFSQKAARQIAKATNAKVVEIDQLSPDWENELKKTTDIFAKSL